MYIGRQLAVLIALAASPGAAAAQGTDVQVGATLPETLGLNLPVSSPFGPLGAISLGATITTTGSHTELVLVGGPTLARFGRPQANHPVTLRFRSHGAVTIRAIDATP